MKETPDIIPENKKPDPNNEQRDIASTRKDLDRAFSDAGISIDESEETIILERDNPKPKHTSPKTQITPQNLQAFENVGIGEIRSYSDDDFSNTSFDPSQKTSNNRILGEEKFK